MIDYEEFQGGLRKGLQAFWKTEFMSDLRNGRFRQTKWRRAPAASFCSCSLVAVSQRLLTFQLGRHRAISGWEEQCPKGGALALLNQRIIGRGRTGAEDGQHRLRCHLWT